VYLDYNVVHKERQNIQCFIVPKTLNYVAFQFFDLERTGQAKFDIYVFIEINFAGNSVLCSVILLSLVL
jgi:hypothetical protein